MKMKFEPQRLKECREQSELTVDALMIALHNIGFTVARNTLINWEAGKTSPASTDLAIIASFYKRPIQYFFAPNTK